MSEPPIQTCFLSLTRLVLPVVARTEKTSITEKAAVIQLFSGGDSRNPGTGDGFPISGIDIIDPGEGVSVAPEIRLSATLVLVHTYALSSDGKIDTVTLENPGGGVYITT